MGDDGYGLYTGKTPANQYSFQLLSSNFHKAYYKKFDSDWVRINPKKIQAADLQAQGVLFITDFIMFEENDRVICGRIFNIIGSKLVVNVLGKMIDKNIRDCYTYADIIGNLPEREALKVILHGCDNADLLACMA